MLFRRIVFAFIVFSAAAAQAASYPEPTPGDFIVRDFKFKSGESLGEVRLHYYTLGTPARDASGHVTNAVLILHGTGGSGRQFLTETFAGVLFGAGQLLDATKYFIVLPDNVGHGASSKPSDGLRAKFPQYDYDDMVALQHELLTRGLKVDHLRLILGTSMGCMHSWVWGETYPQFMDALMPLACATVEIAGRNRMFRKAVIDSIRLDPEWKGGDYTEQPKQALRAVALIGLLTSDSSLHLRQQYATRDEADKYVETRESAAATNRDANDILYQYSASRNYNPSPKLEAVQAPVMAVNSADDLINPPELGIMEREIRRVRRGRFVLLPVTERTRGHGTHSLPAIWQSYLAQLLLDSGGLAPGTSARPPQASEPAAVPNTRAGAGTAGVAGPQLVASLPDGTPVYRVGGGVTAPTATYRPEPEYTDYARKKKINGNVILRIIVGADGLVKDVAVQRGLEPSLDDSSVATVRSWRFQPAMKDGQPVAVQVTVEMLFRVQ